MIEKARSGGGGEQATTLSDEACSYLVAVIAIDLGLVRKFPKLPKSLPPFFCDANFSSLVVPGVNFLELLEKLLKLNSDADTFFVCLASLHKHRLKYERILQTQPIPTIEQVGPRGLLQYGTMSARALTGLMFWRKWFFDIDNRAGQETGYLFEPIIVHAIGGVPYGATKSPIRRANDALKGRQVDCIREQRAYEFKIRVTIASSGQGRWQEELDFPIDCKNSGYSPILIVLDATPNPKLQQLEAAFLAQGGEAYTGSAAWAHLEAAGGRTMALFLEKYVRAPIQAMLVEVPDRLPDLTAQMDDFGITLSIGSESVKIRRDMTMPVDDSTALPDDISDETAGP